MARGTHQYEMRSSMPESGLYYIEFETNGAGGNPDGLIDPGGIVLSVVRAGAGTYTVTLRDRWRRVGGWANYAEAEAYVAHVGGYVAGYAAANTLTVRVLDSAGPLAAVDTTDKTVQVFCVLNRRD